MGLVFALFLHQSLQGPNLLHLICIFCLQFSVRHHQLHIALDRLVLLVFDQVGNLLGALPPILSRLFKFLVYNRGLDEVVYFKLIWLSVLLILQLPDLLMRLLQPLMFIQECILQLVKVASLHVGLSSQVEQYS